MKSVSSGQMRELDHRTINECGISGEVLMERAGLGIAESIVEIITAVGDSECKVLAVAGHGNNAGDAFVAARILTERGIDSEVVLCSDESKIKGDALIHYSRMQQKGVAVTSIFNSGFRFQVSGFPSSMIVLDGLLGTGIEGDVRGDAVDAIKFINELGEKHIVVSIDVPSGMNADTGEAAGSVVKADRTVTMALPKHGLLAQVATEFTGTVEVVDIGIPKELIADLESELELITGDEVAKCFERRPAASHKGTFGHVLVIGGARGFAGAVGMAASGALRSGVGLVTALVPECVADQVAMMAPEVMVYPAPATETGSMSSAALDGWEKNINDFDAVLIGPGMTTHNETGLLVRRVIAESKVPLVLDADALNVLAEDPSIMSGAGCEIIITPHPGEMSRLVAEDTAYVQKARVETAMTFAREIGVIVVLKGAGTVIAADGHVPMINRTGNPGMGTGGMGDVLGGIMAGFVAMGTSCYQSACAAAYIHGRAGDLAALSGSQTTLIAGDVLDVLGELHSVFRELTGR